MLKVPEDFRAGEEGQPLSILSRGHIRECFKTRQSNDTKFKQTQAYKIDCLCFVNILPLAEYSGHFNTVVKPFGTTGVCVCAGGGGVPEAASVIPIAKPSTTFWDDTACF